MACDVKGGYAKEGIIPWKCKNDVLFFKKTTLFHNIAMGRKTWESLPNQTLPQRTLYVLSRNELKNPKENVVRISSMEEIPPDCFIIGGESLWNYYLSQLNQPHEIYLTTIQKDYHCDQYIDIEKIQTHSVVEKIIEEEKEYTIQKLNYSLKDYLKDSFKN